MAEKPHEDVEMAPDPEEDDLDDLDDVLDKFQPPTTSAKPSATGSKFSSTAPAASGPGRPKESSTSHGAAIPDDDEFAAGLQSGVSDLMAELDSNPDMQKQFEAMMQELIAAGAAPTDREAGQHLQKATEAVPKAPGNSPGDSKSASGASKKAVGPGEFSDTIRKTMERIQNSGDAATAAVTGGGEQSEEAMLEQMMRELQAGGGGEDDFNKMLLGMMTQLTNKEILYEPMKELHDKFPGWMEKNAATVPAEDKKRYDEQQKLVGEIVARFERSGYSDDDDADREYIVDRMQKMQAAGSPPPDLVGDMGSAQEALGDLEGGCPQQ